MGVRGDQCWLNDPSGTDEGNQRVAKLKHWLLRFVDEIQVFLTSTSLRDINNKQVN